MAHIILPRQRELQPDVFVGRNRHNPITRGLVMLWNGRFPRYSDGMGPPTGGMLANWDRWGTTHGESPSFLTAHDYRWNSAATGTNPSEATLFAFVATDQTGSEKCVLSISNSATDNPLFRLCQRAPGGWTFQLRGGTDSANISLGSDPTIGRVYFVVGVYRSGTGLKELWVDGALAASSTTNVGTIDLNQTEVGSLVRNSAGQHWAGEIPLAGIFNRALSSGEIVELSRNPWQLFEPEIVQISTGAAAGGAFSLTAETGTFTLSGQAATLTAQRRLTASHGTFALTGNAANFLRSVSLQAALGTFTLSGQAAGLLAQKRLTAATGTFTLTGSDTGLSTEIELSAETGSFSLTGFAAGFSKQSRLTAATGTFVLTGNTVELRTGVSLAVDAGVFAVTGGVANFSRTRVLVADMGTFTLTGPPVGLISSRGQVTPGWETRGRAGRVPSREEREEALEEARRRQREEFGVLPRAGARSALQEPVGQAGVEDSAPLAPSAEVLSLSERRERANRNAMLMLLMAA